MGNDISYVPKIWASGRGITTSEFLLSCWCKSMVYCWRVVSHVIFARPSVVKVRVAVRILAKGAFGGVINVNDIRRELSSNSY